MMSRREAFKMTKRLFVIAAEDGELTHAYFSIFRSEQKGRYRLKLLSNPSANSRPRDVLQRLLDYERRERLGPNTEYWAVIDRDAWNPAELDEVSREIAKRENYHLALSNPCFELWLWLHLKPNRPFFDRHDCQQSLCREWPGFAKDDYDAAMLMPLVPVACERAEAIDEEPEQPWPTEQATRVYRLVDRLK